eukprot:CAMPEP_0183291944 /NCGR_PEP_ID=MMETSP0160_2-20130417/1190_1 /TAXON_ID=2839 ORGANISM="Odontella Sinensis, Strain Grunow 1884" /NCGR_SAMPLE_ID=MMETSP0160_2 /ASSEMBLY_ACC=CAM_ASM_000250 /LENGTH=38 /DNA_ID= /DNA_START= /DNA_END= /DNA_ORIENTATION=
MTHKIGDTATQVEHVSHPCGSNESYLGIAPSKEAEEST